MSDEPTGATPEVTGNPAIGEPEDIEAQRMLADAVNRDDDEPLREPGKRALEAERQARKELERKLAELEPLKQLADLLGGKPSGDAKTDLERLTERMDQYEQQIREERMARWRAEVAAEKGLTPAQAARLQGATREELAADADALLELFAARTPAPDPSQGARSSSTLPAQLTREDLQRMTPQEIDKARREGRLDKLLGKIN